MSSHNSVSIFKLPLFIILCSFFLLLEGCSALRDLAQSIQKPRLSVTDVRITDFNFSEVELTYDVTVDNPNALSVQVLSYDYNLNINEKSFVSGQQNEKSRIEASGESIFQVPMTLNFSKVYSTIESLTNSEEAAYEFMSTFAFDLPGLGRTEVPVRKEGSIPLIRVPTIRISNLQVNNINLTRANLTLNMEFDNPNAFGLNINSFDYRLDINGNSWAEGNTFEKISVPEKEVVQLEIPLALNIAEIGTSAYKMLIGSQRVNYKLTGKFSLGTTHPLLDQTEFAIDRDGQVDLINRN